MQLLETIETCESKIELLLYDGFYFVVAKKQPDNGIVHQNRHLYLDSAKEEIEKIKNCSVTSRGRNAVI